MKTMAERRKDAALVKNSSQRRIRCFSFLGPAFKSIDQRFAERGTLAALFGPAFEVLHRLGVWFGGLFRLPLASTSARTDRYGDAFRHGFGSHLEPLESRTMLTGFTPGDLVVYRVGTGDAEQFVAGGISR